MIAKLSGVIDQIGDGYCVIDVHGVGYLVFASTKTLSKLTKSQSAILMIETIVREDSISLYGFLDSLEKEWFITLTKVQGVGSRVGLAILSALSPAQIAQAIAAQDKASFSRANGVGPKLAARLVTELKDKFVTVPVGSFIQEINAENDVIVAMENESSTIDDAISALLNLGYQRMEAYQAVNKVLVKNPEVATSEAIKLALKEFVKKD